MSDPRRSIPAVGRLLEEPGIQELLERYPRQSVVTAARDVLDRARDSGVIPRTWAKLVLEEVERLGRPSLRRVINATGIVLHTNLGRAPLSLEWLKNIAELTTGYVNLEYDLEKGERGSRYDHCASAFKSSLGADAALVVNNNAAAVMLMLRAAAKGREVVISRGELVEIGGTFRVPDILEVSGARLKEVGTTNRTRLEDYEQAIGEQTALLLKVHRSNFKMEGFVEDVPLADLARLGRKRGIPVGFDAGSATLEEAKRLLQTGVDVFCFSGDKLLGGPQAGVLLGKKPFVEAMKKEPWLRILRVDKVTLALLEQAVRSPRLSRVYRILGRGFDELRREADNIRRELPSIGGKLEIHTVETKAMAGGGSLPEEEFPSAGLRIEGEEETLNRLETALRNGTPPVIGRRSGGHILLDICTILPEDRHSLIESLRKAVEQVKG